MLKYTNTLYSELYKPKPLALSSPSSLHPLSNPPQPNSQTATPRSQAIKNNSIDEMLFSNQMFVAKFRRGMDRLRDLRNQSRSHVGMGMGVEGIGEGELGGERKRSEVRRRLSVAARGESKENIPYLKVQTARKQPQSPRQQILSQRPTNTHPPSTANKKQQYFISNLEFIQNRIQLALNKEFQFQ